MSIIGGNQSGKISKVYIDGILLIRGMLYRAGAAQPHMPERRRTAAAVICLFLSGICCAARCRSCRSVPGCAGGSPACGMHFEDHCLPE